MNDYYVSLAAVEALLRSRNYCLDTDADIEYVIESIREKIPPADVRPVEEGEWICADDIYKYAICSRCQWDSCEEMEYAKKSLNYCPNCGARMGDTP